MDACGIRAQGDYLLQKSDKNYGNGRHEDAVLRRKASPSPSPAMQTTPVRRHPSPNAGRASSSAAATEVAAARRSQSTERRPATPSRLSSSGAGAGGGSRANTPSRISAPTSPSSAPSSPSSSSSSSSTPVRDAIAESQSAPRRLTGGGGRTPPPDGLWPSMRSLSSSFQLETKGKRSNGGSPDQTRTRDAGIAGDRKRSPMRGRSATEQPENPNPNPHAKVIDHHRWPAMMGGRVSVSSMSRSVDLTDKIGRPALSSIPSRGVSPKRTSLSSAANALTRSIDLADKIDRLVSSSVSSRVGSPRTPTTASNGTADVSKNMSVGKDAKPAAVTIPSRGVSPIRTAATGGTRALSKRMDLTEKDNSALSSAVSSPGISPSGSVSSVSNATSQTTKSSRGFSPRRTSTSSAIGAISKNIDLPENDKRPASSSASLRGISPRRRLASDGVNAVAKNIDFAEKDSRAVISSTPSRGVSPRRRLASDDSRPSTSSGTFRGTLQGGSLASDGINALSEVVDTTVKDSLQSTPSVESGEISDTRLDGTSTLVKGIACAQEVNAATLDGCKGHISESMDCHETSSSAPSISITSQEQSPSTIVSDGTKIISEDANAAKKDNRAISVKIPIRGASPRRRLASDGIGTISKSVDFAEKDRTSITMSIPSRGMSPRRTARSGIVDMSKSMDFSEKCNGPMPSIAPSRVVSARRVLGPDGANAMSRSMDLTDKIKQPISSTVRKITLADSRVKGPDLLSGDTNGNESQEENVGSSLDPPSNDSEKSAPTKRLARTLSSPSRGLIRPSSPTKAASSTSSFTPRRMPSPSRTRPSTPVSPCSSARSDSASSILSYIGDATRGKKSPSHMEEAHQLRLLYNRNLQWRFTNAYADEMLSVQKMSAETMLYSVWDANSSLCDSMVAKRSYVQRLRQEVKLGVVLKEQMDYLTHWAALQTEHSTSLSSAIEALRASTLRLPVTGGAKADVLTVKNAVSSAVDIMQAMGSSVCYLLSKLQATHSLVTELSAVAAKESTMLNEYRELLGTAAALQVQESSLRTQLIQETE
uniref:AUGMIN subunit 8 n=1 Tax=Leersia perrieri TaxID=77586 RepID=A0A0D9VM35_9ORYZ